MTATTRITAAALLMTALLAAPACSAGQVHASGSAQLDLDPAPASAGLRAIEEARAGLDAPADAGLDATATTTSTLAAGPEVTAQESASAWSRLKVGLGALFARLGAFFAMPVEAPRVAAEASAGADARADGPVLDLPAADATVGGRIEAAASPVASATEVRAGPLGTETTAAGRVDAAAGVGPVAAQTRDAVALRVG